MINKNFCDLSGKYFKNKPVWCLGYFDLLAVLIVLVALILAITSVWNDSPIIDEIPHIGAGYSYVVKGDHRLNPEHPPLAKDLAGLSIKGSGINDEPAFASKYWTDDINGQWEFGRKLIYGSGNDAISLVRFAKMPMLIFFVLSAIMVFVWTRQIYGYLAALIALFLFSFSTTVIAHSRFVTTDVPALFGVLIATYFFLDYLKNQTKTNLWLAGLIFGVAQLTKFSVFLLVPFFLALAIIFTFLNFSRSRIRKACYLLIATWGIIVIGYIFVVWPVYYFHTWNYPPELQKYHTDDILKTYGRRWVAETVVYLSDKPVIHGLAEYGLGLLMVTQRSVGGNTTYFMGEVRNWAWPQYFPIVYFLKEPLAFWGLVILVWITASIQIKSLSFKFKNCAEWCREHFAELIMLLWLVFYWYTSIRANLNIGVRHLMPVYGFTFILLSGALVQTCQKINSKKLLTTYYLLLTTLLGWYLVENLKVYPFYLTYFNQVAGGPSGGYRYVVDSNLDWGQDVKRLADWVEKNNIQKISLDYFGWADQTYFLKEKMVWIRINNYKNAKEFLADNANGGYIAVSASNYLSQRGEPEKLSYIWLDDYKPVTVIGNSIFVWFIPPLR